MPRWVSFRGFVQIFRQAPFYESPLHLGGKPALYCKSTVNQLIADRQLLW